MSEADERLLIEAAQNDPRRFAELYELNFNRVYAFVAHRVGSREEAQDITSDVFHEALANLERFEWRGAPFAAWLLRIAANAIADRWKRAARERGEEAAADPLAGPDEAEGFERRATLYRLVAGLPAEQRRVIEMRFAEEKSIREIAKALGRSEGAVKQLQFRGLTNLRARAEKQSGPRPGKRSSGQARVSNA